MAYGDDTIEIASDLQDKVLALLEQAGFSQGVSDRILELIEAEEKRLYLEKERIDPDAALQEIAECLHLVWTAEEEGPENMLIRAYMEAAFSLASRNRLEIDALAVTFEELMDKYGKVHYLVPDAIGALQFVAMDVYEKWGPETADLTEDYVARAFVTAIETLVSNDKPVTDDLRAAYERILPLVIGEDVPSGPTP